MNRSIFACCFAAATLLGCTPANEEVGSEIDFVKKSALEGDPYTPCGVSIERASTLTTWELGESSTGLKFVEVEGELIGSYRRFVISKYDPEKKGDKAEFCSRIPAVTNFFAKAEGYQGLGSYEQSRKLWAGVVSWLEHKCPNNYHPDFIAAAKALMAALKEHSDSPVHFKTQFLLPVPEYEYNNGKLIRKNITSYKEGYSAIKFDKGPFAGEEYRLDISEIIKNGK